jgi:hypothetical protein
MTASTALDSAQRWLAELLSAGPRASTAVREAAAAAGHSWRTVENAKAALKVRAVKDGQRWLWNMPILDAQGRNPATPQPRNAAVVPIRPRPAPQATEPQARAPEPPAPRGPWFGPARERARVWSAAGVVRCAGCRHCGKIQERNDFGFCPVGEQRVLYIYANRRCNGFEDSTAPTKAKG